MVRGGSLGGGKEKAPERHTQNAGASQLWDDIGAAGGGTPGE